MARLTDKVALVLGAGSVGTGWGNGRACATLFGREGAKVFCADIDAAAAEETRRGIEAEGNVAVAHVTDVTDTGSISETVDSCLEAFGRIDVLLNNVGGSEPGGAVEMSEEVWDRQMSHNLRYVYVACKHVLPVMQRQGGGSIINQASIAALRHFGPDVAAYAASKAGVIQFTRVTAVRYVPLGIRCNTIVPGLMHTPLVEHRLAGQRAGGDVEALIRARNEQPPMRRMGTAWDVAYAALFLASDESKYITGTEIVVDGGMSATCR